MGPNHRSIQAAGSIVKNNGVMPGAWIQQASLLQAVALPGAAEL
jgi:hypothetical protein